MDNEFLLQDRLAKIRDTIKQYGANEFAISYSGGKDSCVVDFLVDMALPGNDIPRVYIDTGIEWDAMRQFVLGRCTIDRRVMMITPGQNIRKMLNEEGYPFKSKEHSLYVDIASRNGPDCKTAQRYLNPDPSRKKYGCPELFKYQITEGAPFKISNKCCDHLKKKPLIEALRLLGRSIYITGLMPSEGGLRSQTGCLSKDRNGKVKMFNPLAVVTKSWEEWFIKKYGVRLCELYYPPYNFKRTGCKGCPYNQYLQKDLDVMEQYFPQERKQCEIIWRPVYAEYRRLGYRLRKENEHE